MMRYDTFIARSNRSFIEVGLPYRVVSETQKKLENSSSPSTCMHSNAAGGAFDNLVTSTVDLLTPGSMRADVPSWSICEAVRTEFSVLIAQAVFFLERGNTHTNIQTPLMTLQCHALCIRRRAGIKRRNSSTDSRQGSADRACRRANNGNG